MLLNIFKTYFMAYMKTQYNFKQCLSKMCSVMCIVQLHKAKECTLKLPLAIFFFHPRSSHRKVPITVGGLPCIACQAYFSLCLITLSKILDFKKFRILVSFLTFSLSCSAINCCLNELIMPCRVWRRSGIFTPLVAGAAKFIMF